MALGAAALFSPLVLVPATTPFGEANAFFGYPLEVIKHLIFDLHEWPFWDPYSTSGDSLLGNPWAAVFYPPAWLAFCVTPTATAGLRWVVYLHMIAAAVGSYALARWVGCRPRAAVLAPLGFLFTPHLLTMVVNGQLHALYSLTWHAWGTAFLWRGTMEKSSKYLVGAGACLAAQILAGTTYEIHFAGLLYGLLILYAGMATPGSFRDRVGSIAYCGTVVFMSAVGLSAMKLLPVLEFTRISTRSGYSLPEVEYLFAQPPTPQELRDTFLNFFGTLRIPQAPWVSRAYLGLACSLAWPWGRAPRRWRPVLFFTLVTLLSCWATLGPQAPLDLFAGLYYLLPNFRFSPGTGRVFSLARLAIPVLASLGASWLLAYAATRSRWLQRWVGRGILAVIFACLGFVCLPFASYVAHYPFGRMERTRTGFLAALADPLSVAVGEDPSRTLDLEVTLKNVGDARWAHPMPITWLLDDQPVRQSPLPADVPPGHRATLRLHLSLPEPWGARDRRLGLQVGPEVTGAGAARVPIATITKDGAMVTVASSAATVDGIVSGQTLLGRSPTNWNARLGTLARWHTPDLFRVYSVYYQVYPYMALLHGFQMENFANHGIVPKYYLYGHYDSMEAQDRVMTMLRILNVRYLIMASDAAPLAPQQARPVRVESEATLYEVTSPLPRVWIPPRAALLIGTDDDHDFNAAESKLMVYHPEFDPLRWAVFTRHVPVMDDLTLADLRPFPAVLLAHPTIRNPEVVQALLEAYVHEGGRVLPLAYAGYQYTDPVRVGNSLLTRKMPAKALSGETSAALGQLLASSDPGGADPPAVAIERSGPVVWRLRVTTTRSSTPLVISETFYPGWDCTVDGCRAPIYMVDGIVRGVIVTGPGVHTVELWYCPASLRYGAFLTLGFLLAGLTGVCLTHRARRGQLTSSQRLLN